MGDNMLMKFTVSNYKNFSKPISVDFTNVRDYQFNLECVKNQLLSKIMIYGKNASGKSNLGFALFDIVGLLTDKNTYRDQKDPHSFLNADNDEKTAIFEYLFKKDEETIIKYRYEKTEPEIIVNEELFVNDEKIYSHDFVNNINDFKNLSKIDAQTLNFEYYENNLPILRYIANNTNQPENSVVRFIMNYVSHMLWFRSLQENGYIGFTTGGESLQNWMIDNNLVNEFESFLDSIAGIKTKLDILSGQGPTSSKLLVEMHKRSPLVFDNVASSGTRALELFFYWSKKFSEVSFLFMDEFDAFYHYDLSMNVVKYIKELNNVQAIFTTHNLFLASNELLRPDCYFILEKGEIKSFADSTRRELREGHNLEKLLKNGEFDG